MENKHEIISFDKERVWFDKIEETKICRKKTDFNELLNLLLARKFVKDKTIKIDDKNYEIITPYVLDWNEKEKIMLKIVNGYLLMPISLN